MALRTRALLVLFAAATLVAREARAELKRGFEAAAGVELASILGTPGQHAALGFAVEPSLGYEFSSGVAPFVAVNYARWNTNVGAEWELSAKAGARWTTQWRNLLPSLEGALGYGQLVYSPSEAVDIGLRSSIAAGLGMSIANRVRAGIHIGIERLDGGQVNHSTTWLVAGVVVTVFAF